MDKSFSGKLMRKIDPVKTYLDKICQVNPKYYEDKTRQEAASKQIQTALLFGLFGIVVTIYQIITQTTPLKNGLFTVSIGLLIATSSISMRHLHPEIFKIFFNGLIAISGPCLKNLTNEGFYRAWMGTSIYPFIVLTCTGSITHCLIQSLLQIFYITHLYYNEMVFCLTKFSPEASTRMFAQGLISLSYLAIVSIVSIQLSLKNAHEKVSIAEKKKVEVERQKTFLLGFSHELRNLINSIMGNIRLASMENLSERALEFLRNADICGELLLHLINNILDTGKIDIGEIEINPTPTNMHNLIERVWSVCSGLIKRKNLTGSLRLKKTLPKIMRIDHYRLTQILLNIVTNAVKFTERGFINITIDWIEGVENVDERHFQPLPFEDDDLSEGVFEKDQNFSLFHEEYQILSLSSAQINKRAFCSNEEKRIGLLKISVCDTGNGIANEDIPKIFQRCSQMSQESEQNHRKLGTGLGLFITKELCERMKGDIKGFSREGKGSCFIFCLPAQDLSNHQRTILQKTVLPRHKVGAMIVDDESFCRIILSNFLVKLDCEIINVALNGVEAYENYTESCRGNERNPIRLITMDLTMPLMDGKKSAEKIREYERVNKISPCVMIIISANCSESEIRECLDPEGKIRASAFLKKPATFEELAKIVSLYFRKNLVSHSISP